METKRIETRSSHETCPKFAGTGFIVDRDSAGRVVAFVASAKQIGATRLLHRSTRCVKAPGQERSVSV